MGTVIWFAHTYIVAACRRCVRVVLTRLRSTFFSFIFFFFEHISSKLHHTLENLNRLFGAFERSHINPITTPLQGQQYQVSELCITRAQVDFRAADTPESE